MTRTRLAWAAAALVLLVAPGEGLACACCTNPGQRYVEVEKLDSGRLEEIESLRFGNKARLYIGEGGVETITGIHNPVERYDLTVNWNKTHDAAGTTAIDFIPTNPGGSGTLSLRVPQNISIFEIDPRDSPDQGTGPLLYKEWKLTERRSAPARSAAPTAPSRCSRSSCKSAAIPAPAPRISPIGRW